MPGGYRDERRILLGSVLRPPSCPTPLLVLMAVPLGTWYGNILRKQDPHFGMGTLGGIAGAAAHALLRRRISARISLNCFRVSAAMSAGPTSGGTQTLGV